MQSGAISWPVTILLVPDMDQDDMYKSALEDAKDMYDNDGEDYTEDDLHETAEEFVSEEAHRIIQTSLQDDVYIMGSPHQDGARIGLSIAKMLMGKAAPRPEDLGIANDKPVEELPLGTRRREWFD